MAVKRRRVHRRRMPVPFALRTERIVLRPWSPQDAVSLQPVLEANRAHLEPWIPARVAKPASLPELEVRLSGFAAAFDNEREWRYGMFMADGATVLGEMSLFPRSATARVAYAECDRVEIGYWLRMDETGKGLVTEAVRALLEVASELPRVGLVEIRCDARNAPSAAIPMRLGFELARSEEDTGPGGDPAVTQVWVLRFGAPALDERTTKTAKRG